MVVGNDMYGNFFKCKSFLNNFFGDEWILKFWNFVVIVERIVMYSVDECYVFFMYWIKFKYGFGMEYLFKVGFVNI